MGELAASRESLAIIIDIQERFAVLCGCGGINVNNYEGAHLIDWLCSPVDVSFILYQ